ncbi:peptidoglycan DD-metalloendopeptidase family protein [Steroidobacter sp. S1-65]|uniref:Peptidoglycan DD-metalloendopeptidase family protein n=1 Tax=Steroidobacter gossypii TaxID=2805490 RepID=A0ABS1WVX0_9GAMM|nr:peptidoglycan DD-metalloendopeptidase family protein [Steroidobacter gossypii]MBM0105104.1 peptidoglycan DD-metalloendopeptidase family protein [Steroidobacter gossypii]
MICRWLAPLLLALALLAGCASNGERPATYLVKRGDTLYSIAFRHKLDYKDLARWNRIGGDYVIYPGQTLRLYPPYARSASASTPAPKTPRRTAAPPAKAKPKAKPPSTRTPATPTGPPVKWQWPVSGGTATLTDRPNGGHGLMIAGRLGADIRAASGGRVVYTGSGLLGYGQLVIVKHNESYLSAYAHLQSVLIKEGDAVSAGQRIATMGAGPQGAPQLYFEIRINGTPGNPLTLLPPRS